MGYKHMSHIYENPDLTFSEIKDIFIKASEGELEGTEKTDGQNMHVSYSIVDKAARASRNNSMLSGIYQVKGKGKVRKHAPGGVDAVGWAEKWAEHPSREVEKAFVEAFQIFETACETLTPSEQEEVFGDGVNQLIFYNCEVQDPRNMNTIRYDKKTLTVHRVGHLYVDLSNGTVKPEEDVTRYAFALQNSLRTMQKSLENKEFAFEINAIRQLKGLSDKKPLELALSELEKIINQQGISDSQTVGEYTINRLLSMIRPQIQLPEEKEKMLVMKILGHKGLKINNVKKDLSPEEKAVVDNLYNNSRNLVNTSVRPLENVIHNFAVEMLKNLESAFVLNQEEEIQRLRDAVRKKRKEIEASKDESKIELLMRHFDKIKEIENISSAAEGFVFDYNGMTYKFTGNFAPINQILGIGKYDRSTSTPKDAVGESSLTLEEESGRILALIPGKFKPPHRGHLNMAKHYAGLADEVKILVSPIARTAGEDIEIDAEDSIAIWNIYIKDSGLSNVTAIRSPKASPVGATFDFVSNEENKPEWAQPGDKILLGASTKGGDESRFAGDVQSYAREGVEVLNPLEYVFEPPEEIAFNASDFRDDIGSRRDILRYLPDECIAAGSESIILSILTDEPEKKTEQEPMSLESLYSLVEETINEKNILEEGPIQYFKTAKQNIGKKVDTYLDKRRKERAEVNALEDAVSIKQYIERGSNERAPLPLTADVKKYLKDLWNNDLIPDEKEALIKILNQGKTEKMELKILNMLFAQAFSLKDDDPSQKNAMEIVLNYMLSEDYRQFVHNNPIYKIIQKTKTYEEQTHYRLYNLINELYLTEQRNKPKTKKDRKKVSSSDSLEEEELEEMSFAGGTAAQPTGNVEGHAGSVKKRKRTKPSLIRGEG